MGQIRFGKELISSLVNDSGKLYLDEFPHFPIEHVYIISASVLDYSTNDSGRRAEMSAMFRQLGVTNPPVIHTSWANAGDVSEEYVAKLPDALADASNKQNVLFLFHGFGNDVSQKGPWPGGIALFKQRVEELIKMVQDAGHKAIWTAVTYRTANGSNPSAPYNELLLKPLLKRISPESISGDQFTFDLYDLTVKHPERIVSDGVHPGSEGRQAIRSYLCRTINKISNGIKEPSDIKDFFGKSVVINFGNQSSFQNGINDIIKGTDASSGANSTDGSATCVRIRDTEGNVLHGVEMFSLHSDVNTAGASDKTSTASDLTNANLLSDSIFVNNSREGKVTISGLPNGLTGKISIAAARQANDNRTGVYSINNDRVPSKKMNGAYSSGSEVASINWNFTVEDNKIEMTWVTDTDVTYAYLSGMMIEFDKDPTRELESTYQSSDIINTLTSDGAAFDMMDMSLMFKDVQGIEPVTNFGDPVRRINSKVDGVYLYDNNSAATIVDYNGVPAVRMGSNAFRLEGFDPRVTQPIVAHGTVDQAGNDGVPYWYTRNAGGYTGRKWGVFLRNGQYRMFFDNGVIDVYGVDEWVTYHDVYLNRLQNQVTIDGSSRAITSGGTGAEVYADDDQGFSVGGMVGDLGYSYNGIMTHFVISGSELNTEALNQLVTTHRQMLGAQ